MSADRRAGDATGMRRKVENRKGSWEKKKSMIIVSNVSLELRRNQLNEAPE